MSKRVWLAGVAAVVAMTGSASAQDAPAAKPYDAAVFAQAAALQPFPPPAQYRPASRRSAHWPYRRGRGG